MNNRTHVFFQEFDTRQQQQQQKPNKGQQKYLHNCMILEISNNWEIVRELMYKYRNQLIETTDKISAEWINFILQNSIDIVKYGDSYDNFVNENLRK